MEVKWICKECGSVNLGEKRPHMSCFVCGKERGSEILLEVKRETADRADEANVKGTAAAKAESPALWERAKQFFRSLWKEPETITARVPGPAEEGKRKAGRKDSKGEESGWIIHRSPADSREAYVEAIPSCREMPKKR